MNHEYRKMIPALLISAMLFAGCGTEVNTTSSATTEEQNITAETEDQSDTSTDSENQEYFSDRDFSTEFDTSEAISISLKDSGITTDSDRVDISGTTVTIKEEGTYILSGTLTDGNVIIDAAEDAKIQLVLKGVTINSQTFAPIYVAQADKVFVTLAAETENTLSNGGSFTQIDDNNVDAVIFSKDDLTLNGSGSLTIQSSAGHGIVGKDDVTITGGTYSITASNSAIRANDCIAIADGTFTIKANSDGLHSENKEDDTKGCIYIKDGTFDIEAGDDGIHATTTLVVDGGSLNIQAAEGLEATNITINDGDISIESSDDGINASSKSSAYSVKITFNGGTTTVNMGAGDTDGVDSNGDIEINGGSISVTGNSTFDYDGSGVINGGTVTVNGEEVSTLPNQTMGGGHGNMGGKSGQMRGGPNGTNNGGV